VTEQPGSPADRLVDLHVDLIDEGANVRAAASQDLGDLAESVTALGVLQPITVAPAPGGRYRLQYGARRLAAARQAGLATIPAIVRPPADRGRRLLAQVVENLQRRDLTPSEEARAFRDLHQAGYTQTQIAAHAGRSQGAVSKRIKLLLLTDRALAAVDAGELTIDEALSLTRLAGHPDDLDAALDASRRDHTTVDAEVDRRLTTIRHEHARAAAAALLARHRVPQVSDADWAARPGAVLGTGPGQLPADPAAHQREPCHAGRITPTGDIVVVCRDPARHDPSAPRPGGPSLARRAGADPARAPATPPPGTGGAATAEPPGPPRVSGGPDPAPPVGAETVARRRRALDAAHAQQQRLEAMRDILAGPVNHAGTLAHVLRQLISAALSLPGSGEHGVCALLGIDPATPDPWLRPDGPLAVQTYADRDPDSLLRAALAVALVYGEPPPGASLTAAATEPEFTRHLAFLTARGYQPTPAEQRALDKHAPRRRNRRRARCAASTRKRGRTAT